MGELSGEFEAHLTVRAAPDGVEVAGLKFVHIVLDRGATASQPMFTLCGRGRLDDFRARTTEWVDRLRDRGLDVVRVKIEATPWSTGVPQHDDDTRGEPPDRYFEHHVKLVVAGSLKPDLAELVQPHGARLSHNARRRRGDGRSEWFVTQRCWRVGRVTAHDRLSRLLETLRDNGFAVVEVEEEYVVDDDNIEVDAGWLESGPVA